MANRGHVIDRLPNICAAGKISGDYKITVPTCLQNYTLDDKIDALKHEIGVYDEKRERFHYKLPILDNKRNYGIYTDVRKAICHPVETRFQTLIGNLKDTHYASYWDCEVGKKKTRTNYLPQNIDPYETTFGIEVKRDTIKDIIRPNKTHLEVLLESQEGHELYKKSHNSYNVREPKDRKYLRPAYDPDRLYGERTKYDKRGIWVKCCLKSKENDEFVIRNDKQANYQKRAVPKLGECLTPCDNIKCVPEGHTFGKPLNNDIFGVEALLRQSPPCVEKKIIEQRIGLITSMRIDLKRRYNKLLFSFDKLNASLRYFDEQKTGWLPVAIVYDLCMCNKIHFEKSVVEPLLVTLGILKEGHVDYNRFVDLFNWKCPFPVLPKMNDVPKDYQYYETSSCAASCHDKEIIDNSVLPCAGLPSKRNDQPYPTVPNFGCYADRDNLGQNTQAETIVNPSIFVQYGLTFYDLLKPRTKQEVRNIFKVAEYEFSDEEFDRIWCKGMKMDENEFVCFNTFHKLINKRNEN